MRNLRLFIILLCAIISCKKQELNNDAEKLIGKWQLYYTYNAIAGGGSVETDSEFCFSLEFKKKGVVVYRNYDSKIEERGRVISIQSFRSDLYPYPLVLI